MKALTKTETTEILKQRILSMEIAPGQLLDETELAETFGISRTPLREVIQRLAGEGYLVVERNRGAKVAPMDFATMRQFFQAAPMIYASVARLAAENSSAGEIAKLKDIQIAYRRSISEKSIRDTAMRNHRFHEQVGMMAASPYLMPSLNRLLIDHTRISQTFYRVRAKEDADRIATAAQQHDAMIEAFERHAAAEAVELTLAHWSLSRDRLEHYVSPDPLPFELESNADAV
jgi:DNA-binding GntR family transcriptional regulator